MKRQNTTKPGYLVVQEAIRSRIQSGEWEPGRKVTSERDLEKEFNLSRITINKGLAGLVSEGLLERRHGQGTFVTSPAMSHGVAANQPRLVKYISPLTTSGQAPLRNDFLTGMHSVLSLQGFDTGIDFYANVFEEADRLNQADTRYHAGFLVFYEPGDQVNAELQRLRNQGFPFVLVDAFPADTEMDFVVSDNVKGGYLAVEHLVQHGHRRIAYITCSTDRSSMRDRLTGFLQGVTMFDLDMLEYHVRKLDQPLRDAIGGVRQVVDELLALPEPPTALFFSNDDLALEALDYLHARGVRVPEELSVIGYDNIDRAESALIPLTTIAQDFHAEGAESAAILLEALKGNRSRRPVQLFIKPSLIIRNSTGTVPGAVTEEQSILS